VQNIAKNFENSNIVYQLYQLNANIELLYLINKFNFDCIYILELFERKVFEFVYNNYIYNNYYRTLDRLKTACFFLKIKNKIYIYINKYLVYQLLKFLRKLLYNQFNSVEITAISLF